MGALDVVSLASGSSLARSFAGEGPLARAFTRNDRQPEAHRLQARVSPLSRRLELEQKARLKEHIGPRHVQRAYGRPPNPGQERRILIVEKLLLGIHCSPEFIACEGRLPVLGFGRQALDVVSLACRKQLHP
jgi:hypothetical protein